MKNIPKTILALLAAGLITSVFSTQQAQAARINGTIDFAGSVMFDTQSLPSLKLRSGVTCLGTSAFQTSQRLPAISQPSHLVLRRPWPCPGSLAPPRSLPVSGASEGSRLIFLAQRS